MKLSTPLSAVKGVGPATAALYSRIGLDTVSDLVHHYPRRYEDYSAVSPVKDLEPGHITIKATLSKVKSRYGRSRGTHITEAAATDERGDAISVVWFNQPYRAAAIKKDKEYYLSGVFDYGGNRLQLVNPSIELAEALNVNTARILPVYRETKGLTSLRIRKTIAQIKPAIADVEETLPESVLDYAQLASLRTILDMLHFPEVTADIERARYEMGVRELFVLSLSSRLLKQSNKENKSDPVPINEAAMIDFVSRLSFKLTDQQRSTVWHSLKTMAESEHPMNMMVEGDVGSGKTIIAAMLALNVAMSGKQVVIMAPTEILVNQHYETFAVLLQGFDVGISLLSGSMSKGDRQEALAGIKEGVARIVIGTHAVFQKGVEFKDLCLVVMDEQHRFGVEQRKELLKKASSVPHVLILTATPIPRSLALVLYGELDIKQLTEKPPGRKTTKTSISSLSQRANLLKDQISISDPDNQLYIVCPAINTNDGKDSIEDVEKLIMKHTPAARYEVLHGKLSADDKDAVMGRFINGHIDVLLATTVIEVGVNVLTAHRMIIISPERFGLAQLHQLRGRVGRASQQGYCYLSLNSNDSPARRIRSVEQISDGFKLSELDLKLRGPGAIYGTRQSGALDLTLANMTDPRLIKTATDAADYFVDEAINIKKYPQLHRSVLDLQKVTNLN